MFRVRKVKTKSGSTAIKVVQYFGHRATIVKHIGSARDDIERTLLITNSQAWIEQHSMQSNLFPIQKQKVLIIDRGVCMVVTQFCLSVFYGLSK